MTVEGEAIVSGLRSLKDGTLSVTLQTQEMKAEQAGAMFSFSNQFIKFVLTDENVTEFQIKELSEKVITSGKKTKTKGQRLRAVIYRTWEQEGGDMDFDMYYNTAMEKIIDLMKMRLE